MIQENQNQKEKTQQQNEQQQQCMILTNGDQQYKINKKILLFSKLLEFTYEDDPNQESSDKILNFTIPQQILINENHAKTIQQFMKSFQYKPNKIKLKKVEAYYWKGDQQCMKETKKFIEDHLAKMDTEIIKQLISLCRYLQINSLLDVIYYHLASKYSVSYSMKTAQKQLEHYQIKKLNQKQMTELKLKYFDYFHKLSTQYNDIKQSKEKFYQQIQIDKLIKNLSAEQNNN